MNKSIQPYLLSIILLIVGLGIGFFIGKNFSQEAQSPKNEINKLYSSQTANIRGQITAVNGSELTVRSLNSETTGTINASNRVMIIKFSDDPKKTTLPTSDLTAIELNKDVLIKLEMIDGEYQATTIQYVVPAPSIAPISTN